MSLSFIDGRYVRNLTEDISQGAAKYENGDYTRAVVVGNNVQSGVTQNGALDGVPIEFVLERINSQNIPVINVLDSYTAARAISLLRRFGSDAHLWLPGVGTLNGLTCGNYLDSAGTTLGTVDNPVGLVLDAMGTLGSDVLDGKGSFASAGDWIAGSGWSVSGGKAVATAASTTLAVNFGVVVPIGESWQVTYTISNYSAGNIRAYVGSIGFGLARSSNGKFTEIVTSAGSANSISILGFSGFAGEVSNFSVREVTGIHATQSTTANKPVLRRGLVNLLTYSGDFNQWTRQTGVTLGGNVADPVGGNAAMTINWAGCIVGQGIFKTGASTLANTVHTRLIWVRADSAGTVVLKDPNTTIGISTITLSTEWKLALLSESNGGTFSGVWLAKTASSPATIYIYTAGVFLGTLTAQQILDNGGIPLTTTAAASNASAGKYSWQFDGSNDSLTLGSVPFVLSDDWAVVASAYIGVPSGWSTLFGASGAGTTPRLQFYVHQTTGCVSLYLCDDAPAAWHFAGTTDVRNSTIVLSAVKTGSSVVIRVNGVQVAQTTSSLGVATFTGASIGMLYGGGDFFAGKIYHCNPIKGTVSDADLLICEKLAASSAGITI